jgi:hypothetical protein
MSPPTLVGRHIVFALECLQITPTKFRRSKFPGNLHNYIWCPYYLPRFMKFCLVVSEELHWQAASEVSPYVVVHITRKFWLPEFCGSNAPLNLEISRNLPLKQLVSDQHFLVICTSTYGVLTTYQVLWNSV